MYYSNYNRSPDEQEPIEAPSFRVHSEEPPIRKKKHLGVKVTAACLACALVGGLAGGGAVMALGGGKTTTIYDGTHAPTAVNVNNISADKALTISQIYASNVGATVGITTELVTTNYWGQRVPKAAAGSGFVISSDGYIVTNYHVIDGAQSIKVAFVDGTSYDAVLVGGEEDNDLAVLKIQAEGLTPVKLGNSEALTVGEQVAAIGNPLGELTYTLTVGYVSALDRAITTENGVVMNMLQTDTAINNGNSGGPLFNIYGEVIGITSAKLSNSNSSASATIEGLGFAIPINDVKDMITDIIEHGHVTGKPYMGITPANVTESDSKRYGMSIGVYINQVEEGSAAEKAGLQRGDIITALGETKITSYSDLKSALKSYKAGQSATLTLDRNGKVVEIEITFDEAPQTAKDASGEESESQQQQDSYFNGYYWPFGFNPFQY